MNESSNDASDIYRLAIEQTSDAFIFADPEGIVRIWNAGAESIFGFSALEAIVKNRSGFVLGALAIGRDVTSQYIAERNTKRRVAELERELKDRSPR